MYTVIRQKYALHKISRGWLAYLMQHGPFMVHQVFANENRRGQWYKIIRCHSTEGHWNKLRVSLSVLDAAVEIKWTTMRQHEKSEGKNTQTIERLEFQPKIQQSPTLGPCQQHYLVARVTLPFSIIDYSTNMVKLNSTARQMEIDNLEDLPVDWEQTAEITGKSSGPWAGFCGSLWPVAEAEVNCDPFDVQ